MFTATDYMYVNPHSKIHGPLLCTIYEMNDCRPINQQHERPQTAMNIIEIYVVGLDLYLVCMLGAD